MKMSGAVLLFYQNTTDIFSLGSILSCVKNINRSSQWTSICPVSNLLYFDTGLSGLSAVSYKNKINNNVILIYIPRIGWKGSYSKYKVSIQ